MQKSSSTWPFVDSSCVNAWTRRASAALLALVVLAPTAALADPGRTFATPPPRVDLTPDPVEVHNLGPTQAQPPPAQLPPRPGQPPAKAPPATKVDDKAVHRDLSLDEKALRASSPSSGTVKRSRSAASSAGDGRVITALSPLGPATISRSASPTAPSRRRRSATTIASGTSPARPADRQVARRPVASSREPVRQEARSRASPSSRASRRRRTWSCRSHKTMLGGDDRRSTTPSRSDRG